MIYIPSVILRSLIKKKNRFDIIILRRSYRINDNYYDHGSYLSTSCGAAAEPLCNDTLDDFTTDRHRRHCQTAIFSTIIVLIRERSVVYTLERVICVSESFASGIACLSCISFQSTIRPRSGFCIPIRPSSPLWAASPSCIHRFDTGERAASLVGPSRSVGQFAWSMVDAAVDYRPQLWTSTAPCNVLWRWPSVQRG